MNYTREKTLQIIDAHRAAASSANSMRCSGMLEGLMAMELLLLMRNSGHYALAEFR